MKRPAPCTCPACGHHDRPLTRTGYRLGGTFHSVSTNPAQYLTPMYICKKCRHCWPAPHGWQS